MVYDMTQISTGFGFHKSTLHRYLKKLKQEKKFKKESVGKYYSDADITNMAKLLGFAFNEKKIIQAK
jgi:DNA-binding IclR family transcriptional regulator